MPMTALALQQYCGSTALSDTRQDAPSVVQLCVPQACRPRGTFSFSSATAASERSFVVFIVGMMYMYCTVQVREAGGGQPRRGR